MPSLELMCSDNVDRGLDTCGDDSQRLSSVTLS